MILKILSPNNLALFAQNTATYLVQNTVHYIGFQDKRHFSRPKNWRKTTKIVIITLTPNEIF
jgi:hypothetical protein